MEQKKLKKIIQKTTEEVLEKLGLAAKIKLEEKEEEIWVILEAEEAEKSGLLIGYHGETLNSFQHLLKVIVHQETDQWPPLVIETAGYRRNREKVLEGMAQAAAQRVILSGKSFRLPPLPSYERRIIHLALAGEEGIISESEGEGRERRVVVRPKIEPEKTKS
jgi:spoIIIJ-associated protein